MFKKSRWRAIYRYICRSSKNPESLARGVGLGLFIGFLPAIGFQMILAFFAAGLFNANRLVTILGTFITNPFTAIPVSAFSVWLGDRILPGVSFGELAKLKEIDISNLFSQSYELAIAFLIGCIFLATCSSILGYFSVKFYFKIKPIFKFESKF